MAQHDYVIANADGATVRSDLNSSLSAIVTNNSGASAPSTTYANMWWYDTSNSILKRRNAANTAWIEIHHECSFGAYLTSDQLNVTGDGTDYNITGISWTEVWDNGSDFSNGTFTAPVTGKYLLTGIVFYDGLTSSHTSGIVRLKTSNRNYVANLNPYNTANAGANAGRFMSMVVDMDASDTANLGIQFFAGTLVVDVKGTGSTWFSGVYIGG